MTTYSAKHLVHNRWAPLQQLPNGHWQRVWALLLKKERPPHISLQNVSTQLSEDGFDVKVTLTQDAPRLLTATVTTAEDGWDDRFFFARLFKRIDEKIGALETIEGQARDLWRPWRKG